jgi:murein DD-endopeptidase MepM/ murein hydrolase activator NlpD
MLEKILGLAARVRKRYSILIVSGPDSGIRQFNLHAAAISLVLGLCCLGFLGGAFALYHWSFARIDAARTHNLVQENERLSRQLETILHTVDEFEARMAQNAEVEQQLRNLANLEPIPDDIRRLGVGGPPPLSELADAASRSPHVRNAREALNRLDQLNREAEFRTANFEEVLESLERTRSELDRIPSITPVRSGRFSSGYGMRVDPFTQRSTLHRGIDFSAWTGTPVMATADGLVTKAGSSGELGLMVEIDHGNGIVTRYGHNSRLLAKVGQRVKRGDLIAEVGSTGRSTSPHCHYEIHVDGSHQNPWRYILDGGPPTDGEA